MRSVFRYFLAFIAIFGFFGGSFAGSAQDRCGLFSVQMEAFVICYGDIEFPTEPTGEIVLPYRNKTEFSKYGPAISISNRYVVSTDASYNKQINDVVPQFFASCLAETICSPEMLDYVADCDGQWEIFFSGIPFFIQTSEAYHTLKEGDFALCRRESHTVLLEFLRRGPIGSRPEALPTVAKIVIDDEI